MRRLFPFVPLILMPLLATGIAQTNLPAEAAAASRSVAESALSSAGTLPIRRVVLYKNGVGYFEHRAQIHGNQELNLRFTTAQLNDVLKSLTVVDLGGGTIAGVRYSSIAPLSQRLGMLRIPLDGSTNRAAFLNALRGSEVEVKSASEGSATGRLLSVEKVTRPDKNGNAVEATQISLVSGSGELRSFDLTPATSVRILDSEMSREVARYMALVASTRDKDVRNMTISASGKGQREIAVSYISEVPVWKSTYRIVLSGDKQTRSGAKGEESKPLLQGWAVVDNTVGEDWRNVQLSLVAGAPQSFIEQISQPYYVRRPVVELPKNALLTPQTHEGGEYAPSTIAPETPAVGGVLSKAEEAKAQASGFAGRDMARRKSMDALLNKNEPSAQDYAQSFQPQSTGEALGDMFQYTIQQEVTVLQNQSALVPIVQARVDAEKVTLWNERQPAAERALWLANSSGLTLDAGSFEIIEGGAFAGEGLMKEIRPNERRLLSYAADTAVRVNSTGSSEQRPYTRLRAARGILSLTRELRETRTYTVTNSDTTSRTVVIEHPARSGWHFLDKDLKPAESTSSYYRFRLEVPAASTKKLEVAEYRPEQTTYALNTIDDRVIGFILQTQGIQPDVERALRMLLEKKDAIAALEREIKTRKDEVARITAEQARIRDNMRVLRGSAEEKALTQRYVASLNQGEERLDKLNVEISAKEMELNRHRSEYEQTAELITFDQTR